MFAEGESEEPENHEINENNFGIVPIAIPFYTSETNFGIGAGLILINYADNDKNLRADTLELDVFGTLKKQFESRLKGEKYFIRNACRFTGELDVKIFKSNFYEIGPDVNNDDKEEYD